MAEKENKTELEKKAAPAPAKTKDAKPPLKERIGTWYKSIKSECKKVAWAPWNSVRSNSIIVIVCVLIVSVVIGILDYCFSGAIVGLGRII